MTCARKDYKGISSDVYFGISKGRKERGRGVGMGVGELQRKIEREKKVKRRIES